MSEQATTRPPRPKGTILLASGELDKALVAFEIAAGFQAMGMEMSMWFAIYGINSIKRPRGRLSLAKWLHRKGTGVGRTPERDIFLQRIVGGLNHDGARHLPLSQLNLGGIGPWALRRIFRRKGIAQLEELIEAARSIGVRFTVCQVCVDAMRVEVPDDLVVDAEVKGVSAYYMEVTEASYNGVF